MKGLYYLPTLIWAFAIFWLSSSSLPAVPKFQIFSADKVGHFIAYGLLTLLGLLGNFYYFRYTKASLKAILIILILTAGYGISMEFMQYAFFPNRYFEVDDMIANILGSFAGLTFYLVFLQNWLSKKAVFK